MSVADIRDYMTDTKFMPATFEEITKAIQGQAGFLALVGDGLAVLFSIAKGFRNYSAIGRDINTDRRRVKRLTDELRLRGVLNDGFEVCLSPEGVYQIGTGCTKTVQGVYQIGTAKTVQVYQDGTGKEVDSGGDTSLNILSLRDSMPGAHALQSAGQVSNFDLSHYLAKWRETFKGIHCEIKDPRSLDALKTFDPIDVACGFEALAAKWSTNWNSKRAPTFETWVRFIQQAERTRQNPKKQNQGGENRPERQILTRKPARASRTPEELAYAASIMDELEREKAERLSKLVKFKEGTQ